MRHSMSWFAAVAHSCANCCDDFVVTGHLQTTCHSKRFCMPGGR